MLHTISWFGPVYTPESHPKSLDKARLAVFPCFQFLIKANQLLVLTTYLANKHKNVIYLLICLSNPEMSRQGFTAGNFMLRPKSNWLSILNNVIFILYTSTMMFSFKILLLYWRTEIRNNYND